MDPVILKYHIRAIRNYIRSRLDWITVIEVLLFGGILVYYVLNSFHAQFVNMLQKQGVGDTWNYFFRYQALVLLLFFSGAFAFVRKQLFHPRHNVLLVLPLSIFKVCSLIVDQVLLSWALLLPLWIGFLLSFLMLVNTGYVELVFLIFFHILIFFAPVILSMFIWTTWKSTKVKHGLLRWFNLLVITLVLLAILLLSSYNYKMHHWIIHTLITAVFILIARSLIIHQLVSLYTAIPEKLTVQRWGAYRPLLFWIRLYMLFTPFNIRPFVHKDTVYILRRYKFYGLMIIVSIVVMIAGIIHIYDFKDAIQWFVFVSMASAYLFANMSFRFSDQGCELLSVVRSQPVPLKRYWFAKFWNALLPVIWITGAGCIAIVFTQGFKVTGLLGALAVSLFINVTLIFIQTNFALYSYPYTRYASMWYNLYIILGVLFFTILLFPPLSVAFLLFGYLAIFKVLKQLKQTDVLYD